MTENMKVWNAVKQPPATALKTIRGGRLSGMTDVSPQWRYQVMTEQFGQCGIGWNYEVVRVWNEPLPDGQILAFAEILLHVGDNTGIPGIGGSMLVAKEKEGLHASDEGYKMAITDALSVAMKMLGVGADIYAGLWDGTKYKDAQPEAKPVEKPTKTTEKTIEKPPDERDAVMVNVRECAKKLGWKKKDADEHLTKYYGGLQIDELSKEALTKLYTELNILVEAQG